MSTIISLKNVSLKYQKNMPLVLDNLFLDIPKGAFCFLTGKSGAGKSSLLKLLYFSLIQNMGEVRIFDKNINQIPKGELYKFRQKIGVVFQDFRLINHLDVYDNVALPLRIKGIREKEIKLYARELLEWVGLEKLSHLRPEQLSGGQQQRVSIARAVINNPTLLLADEPTGNVDDIMALRILKLFEELNRNGTTIIVATHSKWLTQKFNYPQIHLEKGKVTVIR